MKYRGIYTYVSIRANVAVNTAKKYILHPDDTQKSKRINKYADDYRAMKSGKMDGQCETIMPIVS